VKGTGFAIVDIASSGRGIQRHGARADIFDYIERFYNVASPR
jgi:hypothetical protein